MSLKSMSYFVELLSQQIPHKPCQSDLLANIGLYIENGHEVMYWF